MLFLNVICKMNLSLLFFGISKFDVLLPLFRNSLTVLNKHFPFHYENNVFDDKPQWKDGKIVIWNTSRSLVLHDLWNILNCIKYVENRLSIRFAQETNWHSGSVWPSPKKTRVQYPWDKFSIGFLCWLPIVQPTTHKLWLQKSIDRFYFTPPLLYTGC